MHVKSLQPCLTLCESMDCSPARLLCPWESPGKNTGVGSHLLLQGMFLTQDQTWVSCTEGGFLYPLTHRRSPDNIYLLILCMHNFLMAYKLIMCTCVFACVCVCVNVHTSTHVSFSIQASIWCCDGRKVCVLRKLFL